MISAQKNWMDKLISEVGFLLFRLTYFRVGDCAKPTVRRWNTLRRFWTHFRRSARRPEKTLGKIEVKSKPSLNLLSCRLKLFWKSQKTCWWRLKWFCKVRTVHDRGLSVSCILTILTERRSRTRPCCYTAHWCLWIGYHFLKQCLRNAKADGHFWEAVIAMGDFWLILRTSV